jgi:GT2 family glycosyltransferase/nucleoside-diphosphate-sugar epimerase
MPGLCQAGGLKGTGFKLAEMDNTSMTAALPLTSVVMVSYRTGSVLFAAIGRVLAQTAPVELVLVDNGNPADVMARLMEMAARDPRLRIVNGHGNVGFAKGCNIGASAARGDFLLFLNPDCLLPPDAFTKLQEEGARLKRPYMLGAHLVNEDGSAQRGCRRALLTPTSAFVEALGLGWLFPGLRLNRHREPVPERTVPMPAISGAFIFMPREDFWNIGGFDEGYFLHVDDLDLCLRLHRAGGAVYFVPQVVVTHLGGTSQATTAFVEKHKARGLVRYFHKHYGAYNRLLLWLLDEGAWLWAYVRIFRARFVHHDHAADVLHAVETAPESASGVIHVVGASGRSGRMLVSALNARGVPVVAVIRNRRKWESLGLEGQPRLAELKSGFGLRQALKDARCIISCAHARHSAAILKAAPATARFVLLGSTRRYTRWPDDYSIGVLRGEQAFLNSGRNGVMLHPTMIYGLDGEDNVQRLVTLLRRLPAAPLPNGGKSLVQPIYQDDVVRCILAAMDIDWQGPHTLVIAGASPMSYAEFVRAAASAAHLRPRRVVSIPATVLMALAPLTFVLPAVPRIKVGAVRRLLEDKNFQIDRMTSILKVQPISLEEGLGRMFSTSSGQERAL